ncbi:MAG: ABC transporter ATP-binding protein [Candidatus Parvarchaeota archaeon]
MTLLEVRGLSVKYPDGTEAVHNVSFTLREGEILGIIGESGSGKTTLGLALTKVLPEGTKFVGKVLYKGENILELKGAKLEDFRGKEIGVVFQDTLTAFDPLMRVGHQITERSVADRTFTPEKAYLRAIEIMQTLGVTQPKTRMQAYPHELSGGLRQRAFITMSLFLDPKILVLDEPTTSLDVVAQSQLVSVIKNLKLRGYAMIFITHDLLLASSFCDSILIMYASRMMEYGNTKKIIENPAHPYTIGLLAATPRISNIKRGLVPMKGYVPDAKNLPKGCVFWPRCRFARDKCKTLEPELNDLGDGRKSACHFAMEVRDNIKYNGS